MSFYAYMLRCRDGSYYTGHTEDLEVRLAQHQRGALPGYTHKRRRLSWCGVKRSIHGTKPWPPNGRSRAGAGPRKRR
ncbi:GIY-YIG nuclease family protein [Nostoc ellipsosporum NOK]|nr:GIY-YIG nuclease family protein [Nostoc ellipsosporum NOK]